MHLKEVKILLNFRAKNYIYIFLEYLLVMMKTRIQSKDNLAMFSFHVETLSQTAWEMNFPTPNWRICLLFQLENPDRKNIKGSQLTSFQKQWNVMGYTFQRCYFFQSLNEWKENDLKKVWRDASKDLQSVTLKMKHKISLIE